ncbi:MAG: hybrid sensor histidine kinase/response regulator [Anaerolineae bacterium]|nr:hybrid sensor histidine kinase/response regulator [Anaerolineae bacterium]
MNNKKDVRVLIVEDDYPVSEMIQGVLVETGYTVIGEAVNGFEAVDMTQSLKPDVVLMDIRIPGISGLEAARRIQASCPTPVVVLTAFESSDLIEEAALVGVGAYLIKPPDANQLERAITIALIRFRDMMELRRVNESLKQRNEELDAFSYITAHDLQNPLANIIGFAEILQRHCDSMSAKEIKEHLRTVELTGRKMSKTIEQLLMLAHASQAEIDLKPLDMAKIVRYAQTNLAYTLQERGATIVAPEAWPTALGHEQWVEEVWVNYVSNAVKYGSQPPVIELGADDAPNEMVRFWVKDNGPGIPEDEQSNLFNPFIRLGRDQAKGYGLGLAIVRRFVERMGGETTVESEVGKGSMFTFTLPRADQKPC